MQFDTFYDDITKKEGGGQDICLEKKKQERK